MKAFINRTWQVKLRHTLSLPFIYAPFVGFVILDIIVEIYHHVCFPLYNIPLVKRSDYILIDRHHLSYLKLIIPKIKHFLRSDLCLTLHPKKIYLQEVKHGVPFLGTYIKPGRTYVGNRIKSGFYESIQAQNIVIKAICRNNSTPSEENFEQFISTMNSYLGLMRHFSTFRLRERMLNKYLSRLWYRFVTVDQNINKFTVKFN